MRSRLEVCKQGRRSVSESVSKQLTHSILIGMVRWQVSEAVNGRFSLRVVGCDDRQDLPLPLELVSRLRDARLRIGKMTGWAQIRLRLLSHRNEDSLGLQSIAPDVRFSSTVRIDIHYPRVPVELLRESFLLRGRAFKIR